LVRVGAHRSYEPCKAGSERVVPVSAALVSVLRTHRKRQAAERLALGEKWVDSSLMFTTTIGGPQDQHNVGRAFRARLKAAKVRPVRWYDLRHSFGTHLVAAGVDIKTVSQLMGHKDVTLTLKHYTHPDSATHRAAVERLPWQGATRAPA